MEKVTKLTSRPWYDWAEFDFAEEDEEEDIQPAHIKAFMDLRNLPVHNQLNRQPGIYAMVEKACMNPDPREEEMSELWQPYMKEEDDDGTTRTDIVNVNQLVGPCCLIPDVANENTRAYLKMVPMWEWSHHFERWLLEEGDERNFDEQQE